MNNHGKKGKQLCAMVLFVMVLVCACNQEEIPKDPGVTTDTSGESSSAGKNTKGQLSPVSQDMNAPTAISPEITGEDEVPSPEDTEERIPSKGTTQTGKNNNSPSTATAPDNSLYTDPALSKQWGYIDAVAEAAQGYYTENFSKTRIITKNGYLYNKAGEYAIDVPYLVANGYLGSQYLNKGIEVLLLDCGDFDRYEGFRLKNSESSLTVFASIKHPGENSYLLTTSKSSGGKISASQYVALLNEYYQNHGAVGKLYAGTEEYDRVLSFISMHESKYENYFVRSITTDNRYAMVVLSGQSNAADVKQYVLRKNGSIWEVVLSGLESDPRVVITVNKALPDFNLNMVPTYTINDHQSSLTRDKSEVVNIMIGKGYIQSNQDIKYICGTSNYCYIVLKNELKFVCNNTGSQWNVMQVTTPDEAERKMLAISKMAPTFIILDS